jgi:iron-sulfur cluster repair protein YtfE (RIC family)
MAVHIVGWNYAELDTTGSSIVTTTVPSRDDNKSVMSRLVGRIQGLYHDSSQDTKESLFSTEPAVKCLTEHGENNTGRTKWEFGLSVP